LRDTILPSKRIMHALYVKGGECEFRNTFFKTLPEMKSWIQQANEFAPALLHLGYV
jgi:hypothetical protein